MSLLDHTPTVDAAGAQTIARDVYGLNARAIELPSERDRAFRLELDDGSLRVLKVSNATEQREVLEAQDAVASIAVAHGLPVQQLIETIHGARIGEVNGTFVRLFDFLPGTLLAQVHPTTSLLNADLGRALGRLAQALEGFDHPAAHRDFHWDVLQLPEVVDERAGAITDSTHRSLIDEVRARFDTQVTPRLAALRRAVIHGDANDHNLLVGPDHADAPEHRFTTITGLLDFGDLVHSAVVAEPAVAAAYLALESADPVQVAADVIAGFDAQFALTDDELAVVWHLLIARVTLSVINAAVQSADRPDDPYLVVTEGPAWRALDGLLAVAPLLAETRIRLACGRPGLRAHDAVARFLAQPAAPLLGVPWTDLTTFAVDLSIGSPLLGSRDLGAPPEVFEARLRESAPPNAVGLGGYGEARLVYTSPAFATSDDLHAERRTVHLGVDVWVPEGTPLHAPHDAVVRVVRDNDAPLDYGPVVILEHRDPDGTPIFSLYGHLARRTLEHLEVGQSITAGDVFAWVGDSSVNGGWAPHAHVQVIIDLLGLDHDYPGVAPPSQADAWLALSPDPALLLHLPANSVSVPPRPLDETLSERRRSLGPNLSLSYDPPLRIVRGLGAYLYDDAGRSYLDAVNNVAHVGHAHPRVVAAGAEQMAVLNTNTRYLHEAVLMYADRLTATLPDPLSVCFFVNSGSEANDLALRLMRAHTQRQSVICLDNGYHGHAQALIEVSPYKHAGVGGAGTPPWVRVAAMPDAYRGPVHGLGRDAAQFYAADVARCVDELGDDLAGMIAESMVGCGGQVVLPQGYLADAAEIVRAAGGVFIADEVQVGFGRVGPAFWGFATQGVVPDIVTVGKPAGNGHPLAAVITTPEIANSFANGMEYFNTFGGNPVSACIGLAVLDVLADEQLPQRAERVGGHILAGMRDLAHRHELIGDARGMGMYLGVELVRDRETRKPARAEADFVIGQLRHLGILVSTDGPHHNVLKIKPPIVWTESEADRLIDGLDRVLRDCRLR